jgi:hypothetical protein
LKGKISRELALAESVTFIYKTLPGSLSDIQRRIPACFDGRDFIVKYQFGNVKFLHKFCLGEESISQSHCIGNFHFQNFMRR